MSEKQVYALKSYGKDNSHGYLLFPQEKKAKDFLEFCEHVNKNESNKGAYASSAKYADHGWVSVEEFIFQQVQVRKHFYVNKLE